jgi:hypothetical protein
MIEITNLLRRFEMKKVHLAELDAPYEDIQT